MSDSFALAARELRDLDRDRYAASLVVASEHRKAVQAIFAFAAEAAAVRERTSDPTPGEIRLQWWVDALEGEGHGSVRHNPTADALLETLSHYDLPAGPLVRLLAARRFDLYSDPMPDIGQFEGYAGETVSVLYQYAAMILAGDRAEQAADASGHLGVAQALSGHLRAFGYNASRGQLFLPLAVFTAHGVGEADIYAGRDSEGLRAALQQIADLAENHRAKAENAIEALPRNLRAAFASLALVRSDLQKSAFVIDAPFAAHRSPSPFSRLHTILWWALRHG